MINEKNASSQYNFGDSLIPGDNLFVNSDLYIVRLKFHVQWNLLDNFSTKSDVLQHWYQVLE
jgi:hypothetical protein